MSQIEAAVAFEVDIKESTPRKKKPIIQSRLETSPRPASTPEKFLQRHQDAQERRLVSICAFSVRSIHPPKFILEVFKELFVAGVTIYFKNINELFQSLEKQIKQKAQAEVEKAKRISETVKSTRKEGDKENVAADAN